MVDLIDRQAVIQMFNVSDRFVAESLRLCDTDIVFSQNEVFIVDDMYENLEQIPSAQQWVLCSERLPEEEHNFLTENYGFVICSCDFGQGRKDVRTYTFGDGHFWNGPGIVDRYVKAWQPLPEPWKGENNA